MRRREESSRRLGSWDQQRAERMMPLAEQKKLPWCNCDFRATGEWSWCDNYEWCEGRRDNGSKRGAPRRGTGLARKGESHGAGTAIAQKVLSQMLVRLINGKIMCSGCLFPMMKVKQ